jgi:hypothetical protein
VTVVAGAGFGLHRTTTVLDPPPAAFRSRDKKKKASDALISENLHDASMISIDNLAALNRF